MQELPTIVIITAIKRIIFKLLSDLTCVAIAFFRVFLHLTDATVLFPGHASHNEIAQYAHTVHKQAL